VTFTTARALLSSAVIHTTEKYNNRQRTLETSHERKNGHQLLPSLKEDC